MRLTNKVKFSKHFYENYKHMCLITGVYSMLKFNYHIYPGDFIDLPTHWDRSKHNLWDEYYCMVTKHFDQNKRMFEHSSVQNVTLKSTRMIYYNIVQYKILEGENFGKIDHCKDSWIIFCECPNQAENMCPRKRKFSFY